MHYHRQKLRLSLSHALWSLQTAMRRLGGLLKTRAVVALLILFIGSILYGRYITELNFFVFHDNGSMIVHETYSTDALQAMEEAGIYISKTDFVTLPDQPLRGSVAEIIITRSFSVSVQYDGRSFSVTTTGSDTVASILERTGFEPKQGDIIQPSPDMAVEPGMEIIVARTAIVYEYEQEVVAFETVVRENKNLNEKTSVTVQEGVPGEVQYKYEITMVEGEIVDRALIETVVVEALPQIIEQGTRKTVTMRDGTVLVYSRKLECTATAYTTENRKNKINALGNIARVGTIAVDRKIIPLRSKVYVCGPKGPSQWEYGIAICEDVGGFRGNHVDLFYDTYDECMKFGKRKCLVYVLS